jgi:hypothetical protein
MAIRQVRNQEKGFVLDSSGGEKKTRERGANEKQCMQLQETVVFYVLFFWRRIHVPSDTLSINSDPLFFSPPPPLLMIHTYHTVRHSAKGNIGFTVAASFGCNIGVSAGSQLCAQVFSADQQSGSDLQERVIIRHMKRAFVQN